MPNIQVKNVPAKIHAILRDRAADNHQSLQEFILETLIRTAEMPTDQDILHRFRAEIAELHGDRPALSGQDVLDAIEEGRAGR